MYDAIISDYQIPDMDGIEFLKKVRSSGNSIPFIIFTGKGREEVVIEALNAGADFYLQKGGGTPFAVHRTGPQGPPGRPAAECGYEDP